MRVEIVNSSTMSISTECTLLSEWLAAAASSILTENKLMVSTEPTPRGVSQLSDFNIVSKLGTGSYSEVYKVQRKSNDQTYALKKVTLENLSQKERENALNEVRILASITHDNIIGYKDAFLAEGGKYLCIVMEFAAEGDVY